MSRVLGFFKWIYEWFTVLMASITGMLWAIPEFIDTFSNVDILPILPPLPPETAVKLTTGAAIAKAIVAFTVKVMRKPPEDKDGKV